MAKRYTNGYRAPNKPAKALPRHIVVIKVRGGYSVRRKDGLTGMTVNARSPIGAYNKARQSPDGWILGPRLDVP